MADADLKQSIDALNMNIGGLSDSVARLPSSISDVNKSTLGAVLQNMQDNANTTLSTIQGLGSTIASSIGTALNQNNLISSINELVNAVNIQTVVQDEANKTKKRAPANNDDRAREIELLESIARSARENNSRQANNEKQAKEEKNVKEEYVEKMQTVEEQLKQQQEDLAEKGYNSKREAVRKKYSTAKYSEIAPEKRGLLGNIKSFSERWDKRLTDLESAELKDIDKEFEAELKQEKDLKEQKKKLKEEEKLKLKEIEKRTESEKELERKKKAGEVVEEAGGQIAINTEAATNEAQEKAKEEAAVKKQILENKKAAEEFLKEQGEKPEELFPGEILATIAESELKKQEQQKSLREKAEEAAVSGYSGTLQLNANGESGAAASGTLANQKEGAPGAPIVVNIQPGVSGAGIGINVDDLAPKIAEAIVNSPLAVEIGKAVGEVITKSEEEENELKQEEAPSATPGSSETSGEGVEGVPVLVSETPATPPSVKPGYKVEQYTTKTGKTKYKYKRISDNKYVKESEALIKPANISGTGSDLTESVGGAPEKPVTPAGLPLPEFASGGSVEEGMPAVVGEKGPELFVPSTNGQIITNDSFKSVSEKQTELIKGVSAIQNTANAINTTTNNSAKNIDNISNIGPSTTSSVLETISKSTPVNQKGDETANLLVAINKTLMDLSNRLVQTPNQKQQGTSSNNSVSTTSNNVYSLNVQGNPIANARQRTDSMMYLRRVAN